VAVWSQVNLRGHARVLIRIRINVQWTFLLRKPYLGDSVWFGLDGLGGRIHDRQGNGGGPAPGWELADGQGCGVDFSLSGEQRELTEAAADFARRELNRDLVKREDAGEFPREAWQACARFGVQGLPVPAGLGGAGADVVTTALVMEALGYGCQDNGLLFSLNAQMWSVELPLVAFGTAAQQRAYLPGMVSGEVIGAHAMTEPG